MANLTLVASKAGLPEDTGGASKGASALRAGTIHSTVDFIPARLCQIWALVLSQPRNRKGLEAKGRTDGLGSSLRKSVWVIVIWRLTEYSLLASASLPISISPNRAFRPGF